MKKETPQKNAEVKKNKPKNIRQTLNRLFVYFKPF